MRATRSNYSASGVLMFKIHSKHTNEPQYWGTSSFGEREQIFICVYFQLKIVFTKCSVLSSLSKMFLNEVVSSRRLRSFHINWKQMFQKLEATTCRKLDCTSPYPPNVQERCQSILIQALPSCAFGTKVRAVWAGHENELFSFVWLFCSSYIVVNGIFGSNVKQWLETLV